jgi:hypothetical protein
LTGLLELGCTYTRSHLFGWSSLGALQISRHFHWMIPIANLGLYVGWGFTLAVIGRVWPTFRQRQSLFFLSFPAFLVLLLMVPGLYHVAYVALAGGFSRLMTQRILSSGGRFLRVVNASLPGLLITSAIIPGWNAGRLFLGQTQTVAALQSPPSGAMNVLLVVMDTVRADHLSLYGYKRQTTPNLQRLASRGIRFDEACSTAP